MDSIQFLKVLDALEQVVHWAGEDDDVTEGEYLLAQNVLNSTTALGLILGFVQHDHLCQTCALNHLEDEFNEQV